MNIQVFETQIIKKISFVAPRCKVHPHSYSCWSIFDSFMFERNSYLAGDMLGGGRNSNWQARPNNFYRVGKNPKKYYFSYNLGPK